MTVDPNVTTLLVIGTYLDEVADALGDNAGRFTCSEADAIATIYALVDRSDVAASFLYEHAEHDEDDEDHHGDLGSVDAAATYLQGLLDR